jgi:hypothetical protein
LKASPTSLKLGSIPIKPISDRSKITWNKQYRVDSKKKQKKKKKIVHMAYILLIERQSFLSVFIMKPINAADWMRHLSRSMKEENEGKSEWSFRMTILSSALNKDNEIDKGTVSVRVIRYHQTIRRRRWRRECGGSWRRDPGSRRRCPWRSRSNFDLVGAATAPENSSRRREIPSRSDSSLLPRCF